MTAPTMILPSAYNGADRIGGVIAGVHVRSTPAVFRTCVIHVTTESAGGRACGRNVPTNTGCSTNQCVTHVLNLFCYLCHAQLSVKFSKLETPVKNHAEQLALRQCKSRERLACEEEDPPHT